MVFTSLNTIHRLGAWNTNVVRHTCKTPGPPVSDTGSLAWATGSGTTQGPHTAVLEERQPWGMGLSCYERARQMEACVLVSQFLILSLQFLGNNMPIRAWATNLSEENYKGRWTWQSWLANAHDSAPPQKKIDLLQNVFSSRYSTVWDNLKIFLTFCSMYRSN